MARGRHEAGRYVGGSEGPGGRNVGGRRKAKKATTKANRSQQRASSVTTLALFFPLRHRHRHCATIPSPLLHCTLALQPITLVQPARFLLRSSASNLVPRRGGEGLVATKLLRLNRSGGYAAPLRFRLFF